MATQHEVDVKPYGTRNEAGTQAFSTTPHQTTVEVKPPYGNRNEAEVRSTNPSQTTAYQQGSRSDVEVKPYGSSEHQYQQQQRETLLKPQQQYSYSTTTHQRTSPINVENLKNPLLATALGVTLALLLLSLAQIPKTISHWWHGKEHDSSVQKSYEYYPREWSREREYYPRDRDREWNRDQQREYYPRERDSWRDTGREGSWRAGEMYQAGKDTLYQAKDKASQMYENARDSVAQTGENLYQRARDTVTGGSGGGYYRGGYTEEDKGIACRTAERARDMACSRDSSSWGRDNSYYRDQGRDMYERGRDTVDYARDRGRETMDSARYAARDTQDRAQGMYETAKQRASDMLQRTKETVTYPVNAARDTLEATGERARETTGSTIQAAKDTVMHAAEAVKDTVVGAKDTVLGVGETARNVAANTVQGVKDTVTGTAEKVRDTMRSEDIDTNYQARGPTKVRVEVQEA